MFSRRLTRNQIESSDTVARRGLIPRICDRVWLEPSAKRARGRHRWVPRAESLEDRRLLTAYPVLVADINDVNTTMSEQFVEVDLTEGPVAFFTLIPELGEPGYGTKQLWRTDGTAEGTQTLLDGHLVQNLVAADGRLYFNARTYIDNTSIREELWMSDGTAAGTRPVSDMLTEELPQVPHSIVPTAFGNSIYFQGGDSRLWKTDGTDAGTQVFDVFSPYAFVKVGDVLCFTTGQTGNTATWRTDGTIEGTWQLAPKLLGSADKAVMGDTVFFWGYDPEHGTEVWKHDTQTGITLRITDLMPGTQSSYASNSELEVVNSKLYFSANGLSDQGNATGTELWVYDAMTDETNLVADLYPELWSSSPQWLTAAGEDLYFVADGWDPVEGYVGRELWMHSSATGETKLVADINPVKAGDTDQRSSDPNKLFVANDRLFFSARIGSSSSRTLWSSDGATAEQLLSTGWDYTWDPPAGVGLPSSFALHGGTLYLPFFRQLWQTDGTTEGTVAALDDQWDDGSVAGVLGSLLGTWGGALWKSDGQSVSAVRELERTTRGSHSFSMSCNNAPCYDNLVEYDGLGYMRIDGGGDVDIWTTNGTEVGTNKVTQLSAYDRLEPLGYTSEKIFLSMRVGLGKGLFVFDRTTGLTEQLEAVTYSTPLPSFGPPVVLNDVLYFTYNDGVHGTELWVSDGTDAGTHLLVDLNPSNDGVNPGTSGMPIVTIGDTLYFPGNNGSTGTEPYKLYKNGLGEVVVEPVADTWPGSVGGLNISTMTNVEGTLYFLANDGTNGTQVWTATPSSSGATRITDEVGNPDGFRPYGLYTGPYFAKVGSDVFFSADRGVNQEGIELWKTDGTFAGTELVMDINPGGGTASYEDENGEIIYYDYAYGSDPQWLTELNGKLYFTAQRHEAQDQPHHRGEIWVSGGTEATTYQVTSINLGSYANARDLTVVDGRIFFTADRPDEGGRELWVYDPNSPDPVTGATLVADMTAADLTKIGNSLFFSANDGIHGFEYWHILDDTDPQAMPVVHVPAGSAAVEIFKDGYDLVVRKDSELLRRPFGSIVGVLVQGASESEEFRITIDGMDVANLPRGIEVVGGEGDGDQDSLVLLGDTAVIDYEYTTGGPEAGTIELDDLLITFSEFEPIVDQLRVTNRTVRMGTAGGQSVYVSDDGIVGNGLSLISDGGTGAFESLTFRAPGQRLQIETGDGDDHVFIKAMDLRFSAQFAVDGGDGDDVLDAFETGNPMILLGGTGNDQIKGGTGDDVIDGGEGSDIIDGGPGNDNVSPVVGDDQVTADVEDGLMFAREGQFFTLTAQFEDVVSAEVDWGDGGSPEVAAVDGTQIVAAHAYAEDGDYFATVTATDCNGGTLVQQVRVRVANSAAIVTQVVGPPEPLPIATSVSISADFADAGLLDTHSALWEWGDESSSPGIVTETSGAGVVQGSHNYEAAGVYTVTLTLTDDDGTSSQGFYRYVVAYDPNGGFVTGGGWIDSLEGAYVAEPDLSGKATFGFVSKYKKGASVPTGETEFQFKVADFNFHSESYDWLVVAGANAKYKGVGTINGEGSYKFMITAHDADAKQNDEDDTFRIKIWQEMEGDEAECVIYDNQPGEDDDSLAATAIGGGNIVVHKSSDKQTVASGMTDVMAGATLSETDLAVALDEAIGHWAALGASVDVLKDQDVRLADLAGSTLGLASTSTNMIWIDQDAAGYGWSLTTDAVQAGAVDLLSTLTHELGHKLGLDHDAMGDSLLVGMRQLPLAGALPVQNAASTPGSVLNGLVHDQIFEELNSEPGRDWMLPTSFLDSDAVARAFVC